MTPGDMLAELSGMDDQQTPTPEHADVRHNCWVGAEHTETKEQLSDRGARIAENID